jgi:hypothetical protein
MRQQGTGGWRGLAGGTCRAWPLPADETCARVARRLFRDAVGQLGLEPDVVDDAIVMTSELAANTLHASAAAHASQDPHLACRPRSNQPQPSQRQSSQARARQPQSCQPELWLYLRGMGMTRELVCKVFDCYRGWLHGPAPARIGQAVGSDVRGRGLQIVHELSGGRWGHHLTRARLDDNGLRGKAVWFAIPAPMAHVRLADVTGLRAYTRSVDVTATRRHERISPQQAARELTQLLGERDLAGVRTDSDDMSVITLGTELTLWFRSGSVSLTGPRGAREHWRYTDLVEAAEQTVQWYEELGTSGHDSMAAARFA